MRDAALAGGSWTCSSSGRALGHAAIELTHYPENTRAAASTSVPHTGETVSWETPVGLRSEPRMILDLTGANPPS